MEPWCQTTTRDMKPSAMRRWGCPLALAACLVLGLPQGAGEAMAQPARPAADNDPVVLAREFLELGVKAQAKGLYDESIRLYERARVLRPHPILLFNLAQAHRLAGHRDVARAYYREYLASAPTGETEALARQWLDTLDAQYERERPAEEEAERRALLAQIAEERRAEERARAAEAQRVAAEQARLDLAVARTARQAEAQRARRVRQVGLAIAGGGLVGLVAGGALAWRGQVLEARWEDAGVYDAGARANGEQVDRYAWIATISGASLLAGGVVTYLVGHRLRTRAAALEVVPTGAGGAMAVVRGAF